MSTSLLYHTQGIRNFQHISYSYKSGTLIWSIIRCSNKFRCSCCGSSKVTATKVGTRDFIGIPMGRMKTLLRVHIHRVRCHNCQAYRVEKLEFAPHQKCHYTKSLAKHIIEYRGEMTVKAIAIKTGLHWNTVKGIEKEYLTKKYNSISVKDVTAIGIDEVNIGKKLFLTIVRDMDNGNVLFIGDGKGGESLEPFKKKLERSKHNIQTVAIDLGAAYTCWAQENLPEAEIVYDKFHVIKLMNDKLNSVRKRTMNRLEKEDKKALKGHRYTILKNEENLSFNAKEQLEKIRAEYEELGTASFMKECLRNIYKFAENTDEAEFCLLRWVKLAQETTVNELKTISKTIKVKVKGIAAYWRERLTSASMEGFNNKIGWLNRQAYGYRDIEYFKLKIFGLPKNQIIKRL